jgi:hypothetical protein
MTRSNLYIILSDGTYLSCVADSSSAPEQGYIVENLILPLFMLNDSKMELALLLEHCCMTELRINATYRYEINLQTKAVEFFEERYHYQSDTFTIGENLTDRYLTYLNTETEIEKKIKPGFSHLSIKALVARVNALPDFKWDDEGVELKRRLRMSKGKFNYEIRKNSIYIINDND